MFLLLLACDTTGPVDPDGDGFDSTEDCNNLDATVFPGAAEPCDGADNDCDGEVDELTDDTPLAYRDADGDGAGDESTAVASCSLAAGWSREAGDCDDGDGTRAGDKAETCDGIDNDCNEIADDACRDVLLGTVLPSEANSSFFEACDASNAADNLRVIDADGDGLSDVVSAEAFCTDTREIQVFLGPHGAEGDFLSPELVIALDTVELAAGSSATIFSLATGADVTGDGVADWALASGLTDGDDPLRVDVAEGPLASGNTPMQRLEVSAGAEWQLLREFEPVLVPGEPGVVIVTVEGITVDRDALAISYVAWGNGSGTWRTSELGSLEAATHADTSTTPEVWLRAVGDLDGDGSADLARVLANEVELFNGPFSPGEAGRPPDLALGAAAGLAALRTGDTAHGDLDGDGRDELLLAAGTDPAGDGAVLRARFSEGTVSLEADEPVLDQPDDNGPFNRVRLLDANGDGHLDLLGADRYHEVDREIMGLACLDYGPFEGRRAACSGAELPGDDDHRYLGTTVGAGDSNGDGFDDVFLGGSSDYEGDVLLLGFLGGP